MDTEYLVNFDIPTGECEAPPETLDDVLRRALPEVTEPVLVQLAFYSGAAGGYDSLPAGHHLDQPTHHQRLYVFGWTSVEPQPLPEDPLVCTVKWPIEFPDIKREVTEPMRLSTYLQEDTETDEDL